MIVRTGLTMWIAGCVLACPASAASKAKTAAIQGDVGQFFGSDDYPAEALRAGQQGRVIVKLWIDATGKVASCTLTQSSGSRPLDEGTCRIALERVTFTPATDRRGRPVVSSYPLSVRWQIPEGPQEVGGLPLDVRIEQTISVDATGEVVACNAAVTPPNPIMADPCLGWPVGKKLPNSWLLKGKPVGGVMKIETHQQLTLDPGS